MASLGSSLGSTWWATVDFLLAFSGLSIVLFPALSVGAVVFDVPIAPNRVPFVVAVFALFGAYPFVAGSWSLGALGTFIFVFTACTLLVGILGMVLVVALELDISGSNQWPQAFTLALGYVGGYLLSYRGWYARLKRAGTAV